MNIQNYNKNIFLIGTIGCAAIPAVGAPKVPNVIVILSDDQGYGDFSCNGNPILKTPALDRLHDESIRMDNFHVAPLSTPTRGQLLTGLDAMHNKASTVLSGCSMMRRDVVTMPEIFRTNGYTTGIFGKWHLCETYPDRPFDRGFDKSVWIKGWGLRSEVEFDNDYYRTRYFDTTDTVQSEMYCTDLWFSKAMEWMSEQKRQGKPFFTYLALNAPHGPFFSPEKDRQLYAGKVKPPTDAFFGMIKNIDDNMERLEAWLVYKGLKENTIVVFMNDNGTAQGETVFNAGMRDKKGSPYDGGHRAVCFLRWPAGIKAAPRTVHYASQVQDILPTLMNLAKLKSNLPYSFDGEDLTPVITGKSAGKERMFVVQEGDHTKPVNFGGCVVYNDWRLVKENELYNLATDPGQEHNLASEHPDIALKMKNHYEKWWKSINSLQSSYIPIVIGDRQENPVDLSCANWIEVGPNTQWKVAAADDGMNKGGTWVIEVAQAGRYTLTLSRWPLQINKALTSGGILTSVAGIKMANGQALPIDGGVAILDDGTEIMRTEASSGAISVSAKVTLPAGIHRIRAFFTDEKGNAICGAYYMRAEYKNGA
jgi:arylsulfatase